MALVLMVASFHSGGMVAVAYRCKHKRYGAAIKNPSMMFSRGMQVHGGAGLSRGTDHAQGRYLNLEGPHRHAL